MLEDIARKAEAVFNRLQALKIDSTLDNMEKIVQSLYEVQDIYRLATKGGDENAAADHE